MTTEDFVRVHLRDGCLQICIHRPDKKNALTLAMYTALAAALARADREPGVRVALIHGSEDCFSSGNDLQDFLSSPPDDESSPVFQFLVALSRASKPVVAAVNGVAVGIGVTLLLHCDLVYAGENAQFQLPFVNLGLCPEAASSLLLPKLVGHQLASELLLLGDPFDADQARNMGLVNEVLPVSEVLPHALMQCRKLAAKPPTSLRLTKALLKKAGERAVAETMTEEGRLFQERLASLEAKEALQAFFERRAPDFSKF